MIVSISLVIFEEVGQQRESTASGMIMTRTHIHVTALVNKGAGTFIYVMWETATYNKTHNITIKTTQQNTHS